MTDLTAIYRDKSPSLRSKSTLACTHLLVVGVVVWLLFGNGISVAEALLGASQRLAPELRRGALMTGQAALLAIPAIMACGFLLMNIPAQDRYLEERCTDEYRFFARKGKRFIPYVY